MVVHPFFNILVLILINDANSTFREDLHKALTLNCVLVCLL